jgi:two-component system, NtrC family, sensor histidine kinase KinB
MTQRRLAGLDLDTLRGDPSDPHRRLRFWLCAAGGLLAVIALIGVTLAAPPYPSELGVIVIFGLLVTLSMTFSIPIGGGLVSLVLVYVAAAYLIHGWVVAGWAACLGSLGHAAVRVWRSRHQPERHDPTGLRLLEATMINVAMQVLSLLLAAIVYRRFDGAIPLTALDLRSIGVLSVFAVVYLSINHLLIGTYLTSRGLWHNYLNSVHYVVLYEAAPLVLTPLIIMIYTRLGLGYFGLLVIALGAASVTSHHLALTSERLQRRLQELGSLQAVGHALSESLDLETVVDAIYKQVATLLPAPSFYLALYDAEADQVSFPVVMRAGQRVRAETRRARRGLTEYVLRTGAPLLLQGEVARQADAMGLEQIGQPARCWLGIPILAGDVTLGMFAVQSYDHPYAYNRSHVNILETIAAQAAVAIQNARLYERTDEALTRRVRELDSVLRTTTEGMLLLDSEWRVVSVNRALADFLHLTQIDMPRHPIDALRHNSESLADLIDTTIDQLQADSERLRSGEVEQIQHHIVLSPSKLPLEQTMTPVRDQADEITGWLLVFRDMTGELELARLREDMTNMLVHDLRSPLSVVQTSLAMISEPYERNNAANVEKLVSLATRSCERLLALVDELLDIGRLERGQLTLHLEPVALEELLEEIWGRYTPVAAANRIDFHVERNGGWPHLRVDRSLVTRVLSNLVDNAMKFTPDGGSVQVRARYEPLAPTLRIAVEDTGPGIPADAQQQLFQQFHQVPGIAGRRRGTGLGLSFCKLAVEAHRGDLWVESMVGRGSTFYLTLPVNSSKG